MRAPVIRVAQPAGDRAAFLGVGPEVPRDAKRRAEAQLSLGVRREQRLEGNPAVDQAILAREPLSGGLQPAKRERKGAVLRSARQQGVDVWELGGLLRSEARAPARERRDRPTGQPAVGSEPA